MLSQSHTHIILLWTACTATYALDMVPARYGLVVPAGSHVLVRYDNPLACCCCVHTCLALPCVRHPCSDRRLEHCRHKVPGIVLQRTHAAEMSGWRTFQNPELNYQRISDVLFIQTKVQAGWNLKFLILNCLSPIYTNVFWFIFIEPRAVRSFSWALYNSLRTVVCALTRPAGELSSFKHDRNVYHAITQSHTFLIETITLELYGWQIHNFYLHIHRLIFIWGNVSEYSCLA